MRSFAVLILLIVCNNAIVSNWSTSGLSSGAYFAVQMDVAYSSECIGVGVVAGGPYYCAQDSETTALTACMSIPAEIRLDKLEQDTDNYANENLVDATSNIANQRAYLFSGKKDITVATGVVEAAEQYFKDYGATV